MENAIRSTSLLKAHRALIPLFLCPILSSSTRVSHNPARRPGPRRHQLHVDARASALQSSPIPSRILSLPRSCPGCGAFTQTVSPNQPGFYGTNRKSVKAFIDGNGQDSVSAYSGESKVFERTMRALDVTLLSQMGLQEGQDIRTNSQTS